MLRLVYRAADVTLIASLAGDLNADDFVGIDELNTVLGNRMAGTPTTTPANIPKPGIALLMRVGLLGLTGRRG